MGVLWAARDERSGQSVAIRILERGVDDPRRVAHFRSSALAAARVHHPNIARVLDEGISAVGPFIVTEWVDGAPLSAWVGADPPWGFVRAVTTQVCDALACIHARDLVHLDLRPGNVMVRHAEDGPHVCITDIGCARIEDGWSDRGGGARATLKYLGSLRYMAPEVAESPPWLIGPWSDLYSVGLLLWEVLCGDIPFGELEGAALLLHRNANASPALPEHVGGPHRPALEALLRRLLAPDPESRARGAAQIRRTIEALPGAPTWVDPPSARRRYEQARFDPTVAPAGGFPLCSLDPGPVVGRGDEMRAIWSAVQSVVAGHGSRLVVVSGARGVGKSQLVEAVAEYAGRRGMARTWRAEFHPEAAAGTGLIGALEARMRAAASDATGVAARLPRLHLLMGAEATGLEAVLPALLRPDPTPFVRPGNEPEPGVEIGSVGSAHMVAGTFLKLLRRAAGYEAVVLWLDDVHDAPAAEGVDLVDRVLSHLSDLPICVVATVRTEAVGRAAFESRFPVSDGVQWIELSPLPEAALHEYVQGRLALAEPGASEVVAAMRARPELMRGLADHLLDGRLVAGALECHIAPNTVLPETPHELYRAQVQGLPNDGARALVPDVVTGLAMARLPLTPVVIEALVADDPNRPYETALAAAERARLLERRPLGGWRFESRRMVEWLVSRAGPRAESWHRRWIKVLERLEEDGRGRLGIERAGHAEALGQQEDAVRYLLEAAAWALGPGQHALERGLLAAQRAVSMSQAIRAPALGARAARLRAELLRQAGKLEAAREALQDGETRLAGLDAPLARGWLAWTGGWIEIDARRLEVAAAGFTEARAWFEAAEFEAGVYWTWLGHARVHGLRGEHRAGRTLARQAQEGFKSLGGVRGQLAARFARAVAADAAGDFETADERYAGLQKLATERRWLLEATTTRLHRARIALETRRAHDALRLMDEAAHVCDAVRFARLGEWIDAVRPAACAAAGDSVGARRALEAARLPNPRLCVTAARAIEAGLRHPGATLETAIYEALSRWSEQVSARAEIQAP